MNSLGVVGRVLVLRGCRSSQVHRGVGAALVQQLSPRCTRRQLASTTTTSANVHLGRHATPMHSTFSYVCTHNRRMIHISTAGWRDAPSNDNDAQQSNTSSTGSASTSSDASKPRASTTAAEPPKLTPRQRLTEFFRMYGWPAIGVYACVSVADLVGLYVPRASPGAPPHKRQQIPAAHNNPLLYVTGTLRCEQVLMWHTGWR